MKLIRSSFEILSKIDGIEILKNIERAGRTCYKSEDFITEDSAKEFVKMIINRGHESVLEHEKISVLFVCDRGVSHELVRHRIASFSQESTRYCNYSKYKFENQLTFIIPPWLDDVAEHSFNSELISDAIINSHNMGAQAWICLIGRSENAYLTLINQGWKPEQARSILPNALKTEIVITANLREWRLIFKQRTSKNAHPQMRELMIPLLQKLNLDIPIIFDGI